jgi:transposase
MEATGVYHEHLAWFLYEEQIPLSIVLPNRAKAYMTSLGHKSKNDKVDAKGLAVMGVVHNLTLWQPGSKKIYDLRSLTRHIEGLQQFRTSLISQLEAFKHSKHQVKAVGKSLQQTLKTIEKQIETCKKQIEETVEKDKVIKSKIDCMTSIKGVAMMTAVVVIAETNGFALVSNLKQLTSYAGYDVKENQSGQRTGKTKITKKGNAHIRRAMHLPALNVVRYEVSPFNDLYQRIFEKTDIKMKGYVAVQSKLLKVLYTLWKTEQMFDENYSHNISREKEAKLSLHVDSEGITKEVASDNAEATLGRHPSERSAEVSLHVS